MSGVPPTVRAMMDHQVALTSSGTEGDLSAGAARGGLLQAPKSAQDIEKEQEAKLKAKYGNLGPKKKLMPKVRVLCGNLCRVSQDPTACCARCKQLSIACRCHQLPSAYEQPLACMLVSVAPPSRLKVRFSIWDWAIAVWWGVQCVVARPATLPSCSTLDGKPHQCC